MAMTATEIRQALVNNKSVYWGYRVPAWSGEPDYTVRHIGQADESGKIPVTIYDSRWNIKFTLHIQQDKLAAGSEDFYTR